MNLKKYSYSLLFLQPFYCIAMEQNLKMVPKVDGYAFSLISPYIKIIGAKAPPSIGVYGPDYPMQPTLARLQLAPEFIKNAPPVIKELVPASARDLIFNIVINPAEQKTYNMVFHAWARNWYQNRLFDINIPMGIFLADGVQPTPNATIKFNKLNPENVHVHQADGDALAYSPHNAQFTVTPDRELSSFWSLAVSPDKQHAIVTFHILANTKNTQKMVEGALKSASTLQEFLQRLTTHSLSLPNQVDQKTLRDAILTIEEIVGNEPIITPKVAEVKEQKHTLGEELITLTVRLQTLQQRLELKKLVAAEKIDSIVQRLQ